MGNLKMSEPIGHGAYAPLFLRIALGAYFLMAGWLKVSHLDDFIQVIKGFNMLPGDLANVYGSLLPYMELAAGGFLVLGLWTTLAAMLAAIMIASFVFAFGFFPQPINIFNKDVILLACAVSLMFSGPGAYSIDGLRVRPG